MPPVLVLTYHNVCEQDYGGVRRINALLDAIGTSALLCQPRTHHAKHETAPYPQDFGRRKRFINWGLFNLYWPSNLEVVRRILDQQPITAAVLTSIWSYHPLRNVHGLPKVLDAQNVDVQVIRERFGPAHPFTRIVRAHEARVLDAMDHVFACSETDRDVFISSYGLDPGRISVVPNGVDLDLATDTHSTCAFPQEWEERLPSAL